MTPKKYLFILLPGLWSHSWLQVCLAVPGRGLGELEPLEAVSWAFSLQRIHDLEQFVNEYKNSEQLRQQVRGRKQKIFLLMVRIFKARAALD